jgi:hypothetical protein
MLRVQNQAKQAVSSVLSLAVVVVRSDLQVARSLDQNKIHSPLQRMQVPQGSLSLNEMHKLNVGAIGQGKSMKKLAFSLSLVATSYSSSPRQLHCDPGLDRWTHGDLTPIL